MLAYFRVYHWQMVDQAWDVWQKLYIAISAMVYRIEENVMRRRYHVMRLGNNFNRYLRISCMHIKGTAIFKY